MAGGRPTDYTSEILEKARAYVDGGWIDAGDKVPSIAGMACEIGIHRETCRDWGHDPEKGEFSAILMDLAQKQERELVNSGLVGAFKEGITKMMLSKHGYADATESRAFNVTISKDDAGL